jgi:hypothetical protein
MYMHNDLSSFARGKKQDTPKIIAGRGTLPNLSQIIQRPPWE